MKTHATLIVAGVTLSVLLSGCGKKNETAEELQEPMTMASLTTMTADAGAKGATAPGESKTPESATANPAQASSAEAQNPPPNLEPLPPSGPYKPSVTDIQTALKNAGLYLGSIDGKTGPLTKKAIEEFQKAHNLKVDGKVGPQTWGLLSAQLASQTPAAPATKKKKR